jgi:hypothetical protein
MVLTYARALLAGGPEGSIQYIDGDVRDVVAIVRAAARTLDSARPTALMLLGILHLIQDSEEPSQIARDEVSRFFDGLDLVAPGVGYVHAWRPDPGDIAPADGVSAYGGVARKP